MAYLSLKAKIKSSVRVCQPTVLCFFCMLQMGIWWSFITITTYLLQQSFRILSNRKNNGINLDNFINYKLISWYSSAIFLLCCFHFFLSIDLAFEKHAPLKIHSTYSRNLHFSFPMFALGMWAGYSLLYIFGPFDYR